MVTRKTPSAVAQSTVIEPADEWRQPLNMPAELPPEPDDIELTPADRVAALLSEVTGDDERAVVKVLRENDAGRFEFCSDYSPVEFEAGGLGMIRRQWGAGTFRICLYGYGSGGDPKRYGIRRRETITIARMAPGAEPEAMPSRLAVDAPPPWLGALLDRLAPAQATTVAQPANPLEQVSMMLTLMAKMREAMGPPPQQQRSTLGEVIDAMRELRDAKDEFDGTPRTKEPSLMELGQQIIEVVRASLTPPAPALVPPVAVPAQIAAPPVATPPSAAPGATAPPAAPTPEEQQQIEAVQLTMAKLRELVALAARNAPTHEGADLVVEYLPDDAVQFLVDEQWFDLLCQVLPEAAPHRDWLGKVRDEALADPELAEVVAAARAELATAKAAAGVRP